MKNLLIGIDYSINTPAMSAIVIDTENQKTFVENDIFFYAYVDRQKLTYKNESPYVQENLNDWTDFINRYDDISNHFLKKIEMWIGWKFMRKDIYIAIEGYSYSSNTGLVFNIAEHTGLLKYKLYEEGLKYKIYQPTAVKKFITGKGNADKKLVYDSICDKLNIDLSETLSIPMGKVPIYDFSDSFSILFMLYNELLYKFGYDNLYGIDILTKKNNRGYSIMDENFVGT